MEGEKAVQASYFVFLRKNPELVKVMLASGLQRSAVSLAGTLGIQNLRAMVWGESTAQNTAIVSMCLNLLAMTTGGLFGRLGDHVGRRAAAGVFGFTSFLPAFALLTFGFNSTGLLVSSIGSVLSGFGCSSDAMLVLAHDVTLEEDRAMAFGLFQAATNLIAFVFYGFPALLTIMLRVVPNPSISLWLYYQFSLSVAFFLVVVAIRLPPTAESDGRQSAREVQHDPAPQLDLESLPSEPQTGNVKDTAQGDQQHSDGQASVVCRHMRMLANLPIVSELLMVLKDPVLAYVLLTGSLLAFSGDLVFDIGSQFFRDELDLLGDGEMSEERLEQNQLISVLTTLPAEILIIPGAMLVGSLGQRLGSLRLLKILIPISGICTASGVIMALAPSYWLVPVVCIAQNYAALAGNIPLKHLVAQVAPEGRVGEAMGTLGMLGQAVGFVANAATAAVTPMLLSCMPKPLWIYYVVCGALTLVAMLPGGEAMGTLGMLGQAVGFVANAATAAITPMLLSCMRKPLWIYYVVCGVLTLVAMLPVRYIVLPVAEDKLECVHCTTDATDSASRPGTPRTPNTPFSVSSRELRGLDLDCDLVVKRTTNSRA
eukprot:CAMPEP_0115596836 /NCGR_PEP_ID=MMETSP0272-20121206/13040_1 /TAXON_ID=71861 /ORGANISM="Scrippsiella trochoidea, Strain CCMP3099" /LENGTH=597 /DNA_ID=CAMNT_0003032185 /DNA_START=69 /DNA_END=1863 /DNA_ORIENTATION=+